MLYMVENIQIAPEDTDRYLKLFERMELPAAKARGMTLVSCWHTPTTLGEDVTVTTVWSMRDWAHWNDLRKATVLDGQFHAWLDEAKPLWKGGTRRFFTPAGFSPM